MQIQRSNSPLATLGWAVYLGCSWTWCIGMFLPVLLVRDFGVGGFWVFAIPNVIGAAAMGWVIRNREMSSRIVNEHRKACRAFSIVTCAFQIYFLFIYVNRLSGTLVLVGLLAVFLCLAQSYGTRTRFVTAAGALIVSAIAFGFFMHMAPALPAWPVPKHEGAGLGALTLVCLFGFGLCPYLDLSFHRVHRLGPRAAAVSAFAIGFGVVFLAMILFTLLYAPYLFALADRLPDEKPIWLQRTVGLHIAVQCGFTLAAHWGELRADIQEPIWRELTWRSAPLKIVLLVCVSAGLVYAGFKQDMAEPVYRTFMSFYALVFPAYVWLCMIPGRSRRAIITWIIATTLASPFFFAAFIFDKMPWAIAGLAIVLLARFFVGPGGPKSAGGGTALGKTESQVPSKSKMRFGGPRKI